MLPGSFLFSEVIKCTCNQRAKDKSHPKLNGDTPTQNSYSTDRKLERGSLDTIQKKKQQPDSPRSAPRNMMVWSPAVCDEASDVTPRKGRGNGEHFRNGSFNNSQFHNAGAVSVGAMSPGTPSARARFWAKHEERIATIFGDGVKVDKKEIGYDNNEDIQLDSVNSTPIPPQQTTTEVHASNVNSTVMGPVNTSFSNIIDPLPRSPIDRSHTDKPDGQIGYKKALILRFQRVFARLDLNRVLQDLGWNRQADIYVRAFSNGLDSLELGFGSEELNAIARFFDYTDCGFIQINDVIEFSSKRNRSKAHFEGVHRNVLEAETSNSGHAKFRGRHVDKHLRDVNVGNNDKDETRALSIGERAEEEEQVSDGDKREFDVVSVHTHVPEGERRSSNKDNLRVLTTDGQEIEENHASDRSKRDVNVVDVNKHVAEANTSNNDNSTMNVQEVDEDQPRNSNSNREAMVLSTDRSIRNPERTNGESNNGKVLASERQVIDMKVRNNDESEARTSDSRAISGELSNSSEGRANDLPGEKKKIGAGNGENEADTVAVTNYIMETKQPYVVERKMADPLRRSLVHKLRSPQANRSRSRSRSPRRRRNRRNRDRSPSPLSSVPSSPRASQQSSQRSHQSVSSHTQQRSQKNIEDEESPSKSSKSQQNIEMRNQLIIPQPKTSDKLGSKENTFDGLDDAGFDKPIASPRLPPKSPPISPKMVRNYKTTPSASLPMSAKQFENRKRLAAELLGKNEQQFDDTMFSPRPPSRSPSRSPTTRLDNETKSPTLLDNDDTNLNQPMSSPRSPPRSPPMSPKMIRTGSFHSKKVEDYESSTVKSAGNDDMQLDKPMSSPRLPPKSPPMSPKMIKSTESLPSTRPLSSKKFEVEDRYVIKFQRNVHTQSDKPMPSPRPPPRSPPMSPKMISSDERSPSTSVARSMEKGENEERIPTKYQRQETNEFDMPMLSPRTPPRSSPRSPKGFEDEKRSRLFKASLLSQRSPGDSSIPSSTSSPTVSHSRSKAVKLKIRSAPVSPASNTLQREPDGSLELENNIKREEHPTACKLIKNIDGSRTASLTSTSESNVEQPIQMTDDDDANATMRDEKTQSQIDTIVQTTTSSPRSSSNPHIETKGAVESPTSNDEHIVSTTPTLNTSIDHNIPASVTAALNAELLEIFAEEQNKLMIENQRTVTEARLTSSANTEYVKSAVQDLVQQQAHNLQKLQGTIQHSSEMLEAQRKAVEAPRLQLDSQVKQVVEELEFTLGSHSRKLRIGIHKTLCEAEDKSELEVEKLSRDLSEMNNTRQAKVESMVRGLSEKFQESFEEEETILEKLVEAELISMQERRETLRGLLDRLQYARNDGVDEVAQIQNGVNGTIDDVHETIGDVGAHFDNVHETIGEHETVADVHETIGDFQGTNTNVNKIASDVHGKIGDVRETIDDVQGSNDDVHEILRDVHETIENIHETASNVHGNIDDAHGTNANVHKTIDGVRKTKVDVQGNMDDVHEIGSDVHETIHVVHGNIDHVHETIGDVQGKNDSVHQTVDDVEGRSDHARETIKHVHDTIVDDHGTNYHVQETSDDNHDGHAHETIGIQGTTDDIHATIDDVHNTIDGKQSSINGELIPLKMHCDKPILECAILISGSKNDEMHSILKSDSQNAESLSQNGKISMPEGVRVLKVTKSMKSNMSARSLSPSLSVRSIKLPNADDLFGKQSSLCSSARSTPERAIKSKDKIKNNNNNNNKLPENENSKSKQTKHMNISNEQGVEMALKHISETNQSIANTIMRADQSDAINKPAGLQSELPGVEHTHGDNILLGEHQNEGKIDKEEDGKFEERTDLALLSRRSTSSSMCASDENEDGGLDSRKVEGTTRKTSETVTQNTIPVVSKPSATTKQQVTKREKEDQSMPARHPVQQFLSLESESKPPPSVEYIQSHARISRTSVTQEHDQKEKEVESSSGGDCVNSEPIDNSQGGAGGKKSSFCSAQSAPEQSTKSEVNNYNNNNNNNTTNISDEQSSETAPKHIFETKQSIANTIMRADQSHALNKHKESKLDSPNLNNTYGSGDGSMKIKQRAIATRSEGSSSQKLFGSTRSSLSYVASMPSQVSIESSIQKYEPWVVQVNDESERRLNVQMTLASGMTSFSSDSDTLTDDSSNNDEQINSQGSTHTVASVDVNALGRVDQIGKSTQKEKEEEEKKGQQQQQQRQQNIQQGVRTNPAEEVELQTNHITGANEKHDLVFPSIHISNTPPNDNDDDESSSSSMSESFASTSEDLRSDGKYNRYDKADMTFVRPGSDAHTMGIIYMRSPNDNNNNNNNAPHTNLNVAAPAAGRVNTQLDMAKQMQPGVTHRQSGNMQAVHKSMSTIGIGSISCGSSLSTATRSISSSISSGSEGESDDLALSPTHSKTSTLS